MEKRILEFDIYRDSTGYWAQAREMTNMMSTGQTLDELLANMSEVIDLCLDDTIRADRLAQAGPDGPSADEAPAPVPDTHYLTRVVRMDIEVQADNRPPATDAITQPPSARKRQSHREDWPPAWRESHD